MNVAVGILTILIIIGMLYAIGRAFNYSIKRDKGVLDDIISGISLLAVATVATIALSIVLLILDRFGAIVIQILGLMG